MTAKGKQGCLSRLCQSRIVSERTLRQMDWMHDMEAGTLNANEANQCF